MFIVVVAPLRSSWKTSDGPSVPIPHETSPMKIIFPMNIVAFITSTLAMVGGLVSCKKEAVPELAPGMILYKGATDGSAAVAIDATHFVTAYDEESVLRVFSKDAGGEASDTVDLKKFLGGGKDADSDIEGATLIGSRSYWITSHGRSKSGKDRPEQRKFFALDHQSSASGVKLVPVGSPYSRLLDDLIADSRFAAFKLGEASQLPPKEKGGLSIESLCATPDKTMLIGFRNPIPEAKSLLIPLKNPDQVIAGQKAEFGEPVRLDLKGLGLRDMAWADGKYIIIGGPFGGNGKSRLFTWLGGNDVPREIETVDLKGFNAESIVVYGGSAKAGFQLLSDDSNAETKAGDAPLTFRGRWIAGELIQ